jgi:hypothetical protein
MSHPVMSLRNAEELLRMATEAIRAASDGVATSSPTYTLTLNLGEKVASLHWMTRTLKENLQYVDEGHGEGYWTLKDPESLTIPDFTSQNVTEKRTIKDREVWVEYVPHFHGSEESRP